MPDDKSDGIVNDMTDTATSTYDRMKVAELQELARTREITFTSKTRKPDLIKLLLDSDIQAVADEVVSEMYAEMNSQPARFGALKLHPAQMRLNYARQNTRNPKLTGPEALNVKLTRKQLRAINRQTNRMAANPNAFKEITF